MAYKSSDDHLINLEFYNKMLTVKDPAFFKEVDDIVDNDLFRWYLHTDKVYQQEKKWQELMNLSNQEVLFYAWDEMLRALDAVFQNYVSLKYS